jgi:ketosteroid isomerase-like protein
MELPALVKDYFTHLAAGRLSEATQSFAPDVFYSHEAYDPGTPGPTSTRLEARGRDALLQMFTLRAQRPRTWRHEYEATMAGDKFFIHGRAIDADNQPVLSFLAEGKFNADGLISSYIEYDTRPPVGSATAVEV